MNGPAFAAQCIKSPAANACIFKRIEGPSNALVWTFFHLSEMDAFSRSEMDFGLHRRLRYKFPLSPERGTFVRARTGFEEKRS